ncbi:chromosome segregation protein SMC [Streptococcus pacificus]|uniref:Chromosome partition protein Smc n=1 Tax=Streptococcus pacificus TaxID=2740577 RepID=A0ABS0ZJJ9_9STRE|nr:chromosome segregation protein SMC [Streptococcus pacificus]MBJ8325893.1 chromosome segregation protein SMC [Streptococcus pacificus]
MYLKQIEMYGFKSFADKTKIDFNQGITAVVGPNGSGKSNITESLRWALGESSAKNLRGGKMPDVIFAGTESRKALNYAQVTVTLDNSDGFIANANKEIKVERHVYRNGDSDYLIDGKKVRLKDIHSLFMDTGLGRDSFSIISQGRVETIFNSKPEERRAIFEEVAGVLKYKTRKKETESKLNQTQSNLDRLDDIIYELDNQIKPLLKQAKAAKEYLTLEDKRKSLQLDILVADIISYKQDLSDKKTSLKEATDNLKHYYAKKDALEKENQTLKLKRHQLSEEKDKVQTDLMELTRLISELERKIAIITLESHQKEEKQALTKETLDKIAKQQLTLKQSILAKKDYLTTLEENSQSLKLKINNLEKELERFSTHPDDIIEGFREDFVALMHQEADLSNQLTSVLAAIENQEESLKDKEKEKEHLVNALDQLKKTLSTVQTSHNDAKELVERLLKAHQSQVNQLNELDNLYQTSQTELFDRLDRLKNKEARKNSLETILKNHSQFYSGVKSVLQNATEIKDIIGAVSEKISFDKKYQTAIEIALGASSQHVIVADEMAAKRAIQFLKKTRQGRATFLPLTTIKARQLSAHNQRQLQKANGYLGVASDLVSFDGNLANIFNYLLGTTVIFEDTNKANEAARLVNYQVRLVTLDGTEIRPGGSFSGGANRQNNSLFIKPELDGLKSEINQLKATVVSDEKQVETLKQEISELRQAIENTKNQGEMARLEEQKLSIELTRLSEELKDRKTLIAHLENGQKNERLETLVDQKTTIENKLEAITKEKSSVTIEIEKIKKDKDSIIQTVETLTKELSKERLVERDLMNELKFEQTNLSRLQEELVQLEDDYEKNKTLLDDHLSAINEDELPTLKLQLDNAKKEKEDYQSHAVRLQYEWEDSEGALDDLSEQIQKISQQNEGFIRTQTQLESQIEQISNKLRQFATLLSEDYQMSFSMAQEVANEIDEMPKAKEQLREYLNAIKKLGPVNLDAVEQYDEVKERLDFLNSQRADLTSAKELLLSTIHDMDDEVKVRFKTTFEAVRDSFKQTFKQMFGGGTADLQLTDGDLLTSGVEISVQPPGKKIQSLNLMSGGEKALSALALLFAIIRVKTIPFVILDEVEAALDEANVKRFGDYLNRFDKSSQFIVVTHRKGTMAAADSIYGVTMQESGVSKIVSVKLKDAEQLVQ